MEEEGFGGVVDVRWMDGVNLGLSFLKTFLWHSCCGVEE
jgi:hypothetical protein